MKKHWSTEELQEFWKLLPEEKNLLGNKAGVQRFCYLLILKCYSTNYSFPKDVCDIPTKLLAFGLTQYNTDITLDEVTNFLKNYRNYIRYKKEIRTYYGVCKFNEANHAYKVANHLGTNHHVEILKPVSNFLILER